MDLLTIICLGGCETKFENVPINGRESTVNRALDGICGRHHLSWLKASAFFFEIIFETQQLILEIGIAI
jgi:hypothetical protein